VIKTVAYFPLQCALNSRPVIGAVLDCLQASGIQTQENSMDSDAAVIWSVLWHGRMKDNQKVYEHYRSQGKPVIIIEIGALYRGNTWKISVNNVNAKGYYGHLENLDWGRPRKLHISLATQTISKPEIIIALQHIRSLQVAHIPDMAEWLKQTISAIRNNSDRPIVVRPHPRCRMPLPVLPPDIKIEQPKPMANTYDSFDMHFDCHAVVNYNSGPGIQAAIAGVRPVVDNTSLAYPVGVGFADIEQPYLVDRDLWLAQICHTEYTVDEIKKGIWLRRIQSALMA
jgi:hypothetical protein